MEVPPEAFPSFIPDTLPELPIGSDEPELLLGDEFAEPDIIAEVECDEGEVSSFQFIPIFFQDSSK